MSKFWIAKKIVMVLTMIALLGWVIMSLWNWIIPSLFVDVQTISYVKALGLLVLSRILFGGFHGRGGWMHHKHMQRWEQMTPEEREKFQHGLSGFRSRHRE